MLATVHNLHYYQQLMREIRAAIEAGAFGAFREGFYRDLRAGEPT
jgi:queuine tRNA-ribosyltransferase